jgi:hypothetical protein
MANQRKLGDNLADLQRSLCELAPAPARMNVAQTMYLAGQQSLRHRQRRQAFWPLSTVCLAVACVTLAILQAKPAQPQPQIVYVPVETTVPTETAEEPDRPPVESAARAEQVAPPGDVPWGSSRLAVQPWDELLDQILNDRLDTDQVNTSSVEPVIMETICCSDWPKMLTDQSEGERFRSLVEPLHHQPAMTLQYLTTLFSPKGS